MPTIITNEELSCERREIVKKLTNALTSKIAYSIVGDIDTVGEKTARAYFAQRRPSIPGIIRSEVDKIIPEIAAEISLTSEDLDKKRRDVAEVEAKLRELHEEREELLRTYHDPKLADAMRVYKEISEPHTVVVGGRYDEQEVPEDKMLQGKRITAAYMIAAAYLGMTSIDFSQMPKGISEASKQE